MPQFPWASNEQVWSPSCALRILRDGCGQWGRQKWGRALRAPPPPGGKFHLTVNTRGPRQFCCENSPPCGSLSGWGAQGSEKWPQKVPSVGRGRDRGQDWGRSGVLHPSPGVGAPETKSDVRFGVKHPNPRGLPAAPLDTWPKRLVSSPFPGSSKPLDFLQGMSPTPEQEGVTTVTRGGDCDPWR